MKMRSSSASKPVISKGMCCPTGAEAREKYRDYNPMPINPLKQQFEPTPAEAVRAHAKMAGC
jgi:hypothetical protein